MRKPAGAMTPAGFGIGEELRKGVIIGEDREFDEAEIRAAELRLAAALQDPDPTAWVFEYTADAVFDAGGDRAVQGREALLTMANAMQPLSSVSIRPLRTEGSGDCAVVWFAGSWCSGGSAEGSRTVQVRGIIVWRREPDGRWRVAMEHLS